MFDLTIDPSSSLRSTRRIHEDPRRGSSLFLGPASSLHIGAVHIARVGRTAPRQGCATCRTSRSSAKSIPTSLGSDVPVEGSDGSTVPGEWSSMGGVGEADGVGMAEVLQGFKGSKTEGLDGIKQKIYPTF